MKTGLELRLNDPADVDVEAEADSIEGADADGADEPFPRCALALTRAYGENPRNSMSTTGRCRLIPRLKSCGKTAGRTAADSLILFAIRWLVVDGIHSRRS